MNSFRKHHLLQILEKSEKSPMPLDSFMRSYFRTHKSIGSKDRKEICDHVYEHTRWRGLIEYKAKKKNHPIPEHIQVSFPKWLYDRLGKAASLESNFPAPITIRINPLKVTRDELLKKFPHAQPCKHSSLGIVFPKRENFLGMPEFKAGLFEVQDEGSQLVADLVDAKPGDHVLDYCAGSGGKTLAFAHKMNGKGQIYLHDVRPHALAKAKKRLKRAGIQNAQIPTRLPKVDWLLLDVPCSGTGTLRRNPEMKWKLTPEKIEELVFLQRNIVDEALPYLKKSGHLVYATCSLLKEENDDQVAYIQSKGMKLVAPPFRSTPKKDGMDGFFAAVFSPV